MSSRLQYTIALGIIALGALLPLITLDVSLYESDEPYQAYCTLAPEAMSPIAPLTFAMGRWWQTVFGEGLLQLRWLAYVIRLATALVGAIWLGRTTRRPIAASVAFFAAMACVSTDLMYDWNSTSLLWLVALAITLVEYWNRPSWEKVVAIGVLSALATLSRLPSGVAILVAAGVIIAKGFSNTRMRERTSERQIEGTDTRLGQRVIPGRWPEPTLPLGVGVAAFLLAYFGGAWLCFGSIDEYFGRWGERYFVTGHDGILATVWHDLPRYLAGGCATFLLGVGCSLWAWLAWKSRVNRWSLWVDYLIGAVVSCWAMQRLVSHGGWVTGLTLAWYMLCVAGVVANWKGMSQLRRVAGVLALLFMIVQMAGSNVPWERFSVASCLCLWIFAVLGKDGPWRWLSGATLAMIAAMVGFNAMYPFRIECKWLDFTVNGANATLEIPYFEGIKVNQEYKTKLETNYQAILPYAQSPKGILILGHDKFVDNLSLRGINSRDEWPHRFEFNDQRQARQLERELDSTLPRYDHVAIGQARPWHFDEVVAIYEPMLLARGFHPVLDTGQCCRIYSRKTVHFQP
ncbi:MAG: hypothetical protein LIP02_07045 [Bacteroidales bacterium]|nr:hypothetical protein [Bacteroidales bacterium]